MSLHKHKKLTLLSLALGLVLAFGLAVLSLPATVSDEGEEANYTYSNEEMSSPATEVRAPDSLAPYVISNPYEGVDWENFGQYRASLHNHTQNSGGKATTAEMIEQLYVKDYDIVAITDHNYLTTRWSEVDKGAMSTQREAEILTGFGRSGRPLIPILFANEQSYGKHVNTYFADFNNSREMSREDVIRQSEELGGISVINHPGRYTNVNPDEQIELSASHNLEQVQKHVDLFMRHPGCVGLEIVNGATDRFPYDRALWDNILARTMPRNRPVWGFANDDAHHLEEIGFAYNVLLIDRDKFDEFALQLRRQFGLGEHDAKTSEELKELSASNPVREAMTQGSFYAVSRIDNSRDSGELKADDKADKAQILAQTTPSITNIELDQSRGVITLTADNYDYIEWIADGAVIAKGNTLVLGDYSSDINSYVRAQVISSSGIAFTQPFGISLR